MPNQQKHLRAKSHRQNPQPRLKSKSPQAYLEAESEGEGTKARSEAILRIGWTSEIDTLNPLTTYITEASEVLQLIYDKLLGFSYEFIPQSELAKEYSYSEDGLSITFKLRDNAMWHDGKPLSADDVVFTYTFHIHKPWYQSSPSPIQPQTGNKRSWKVKPHPL